ncbi:class II fructose-bisphosphate aldolase [Jannaschia sp. LMIT008]|uniref:class II fructose-bisphosphate aldolase n=1 Tax=Jannaschia maritima TaxID=3032585 RepID=UPI0028128AE6|nr:class II fructose-bisphosphate aldolase [Jannaschia sp. LMIT008]
MTRATLADVLAPGRAVAGLVCLGWEDARAYALAAQDVGAPVILQAGPSARAHTPLPVWGAMFRELAGTVSVPVVSHLDHGADAAEARAALAAGFTSVMFDGSRLPFDDNVARTKAVADMARAAGASSEGEIGFVGYASGEPSWGTDPGDAARFAALTGVDALAVSAGNVHLRTDATTGLDLDRLRAIRAITDVPLVIHGGSGVPHAQRAALARDGLVAKFNVGTELRQVFGRALRDALAADPHAYDRVAILKAVEGPLREAARAIIAGMWDV